MIDVHIFDQTSGTPLKESDAKKIAISGAADLGLDKGSINIIFVNDSTLAELHSTYLDDDKPTDIMTFDLSEDESELEAELYISVERAKDHAQQFKVSCENELARLIIHGLLHLAGFDDHSKADYKKMKNEEERLLKSCFNPL